MSTTDPATSGAPSGPSKLQEVLAILETGTTLLGAVDPAVAATTEEIASLENIAGRVLSVLAAQKGMTIDQVVAGLTPEAPIT